MVTDEHSISHHTPGPLLLITVLASIVSPVEPTNFIPPPIQPQSQPPYELSEIVLPRITVFRSWYAVRATLPAPMIVFRKICVPLPEGETADPCVAEISESRTTNPL